MPSTYAHYLFGKEVYRNLGDNIKNMINLNKELYLIGLHGPDILFYYKPLQSNAINSLGYGMHEKIASEFFEKSNQIIANSNDSDGQKAYILGFICHYMLDSECHQYIGEKIQSSGVSHAEIEVEFDRYLLVSQDKNPIKTKLTKHIVATKSISKCISCFYEDVSAKAVLKALRSMKFYNDLLVAPGKLKRLIIEKMLIKTGNYEEMHGLMVNDNPNPECIDSCEELQNRFTNAVLPTALLIKEYFNNLNTNSKLNKRFERNFE